MKFRSQTLVVREASRQLATLTRDEKDRALHAMADAMATVEKKLLATSAVDVDAARRSGTPEVMIDRLRLNGNRVRGTVDGLHNVATLPGPVSDLVRGWRLGNGAEVRQVRVPFGMVGIIYENHPNVTADAAGLCLRSGNAALLRDSSSVIESNRIYVEALREGLRNIGVNADAAALMEEEHEVTGEMMTVRGLADVLVPQDGTGLISVVVEGAKVPVIGADAGNCHLYVDASADIGKAVAVLLNTKTQRPSVCSVVETLLVHRGVAGALLPVALDALHDAGVTIHGAPGVVVFADDVVPAGEDESDAEYLSLDLAVRIVADIDEAITHIHRHTAGHSKTVATEPRATADRLATEIDAAAVLMNAPSRFIDGGQFGLGTEVGVSTQKLHTRGPMGLAELTSAKYIVNGDG